ncbi:SDR family NAD(P)-dependent oxidoreductase [Dactylosporangium sp. CA-152071]|uniref:SDR family NAD(P)-dependent oxidoreductase n=1 Tax=Dactylosporangium sp. CA-152071 TaxID=3239933 RepID=UPI003D8D6B22
MNRFDGKTFLITGGGSGMGLAAAATLLDDGANVVLAGRSQARLQTAAKELDAGDRVLTVATDVANVADLDALVAAIGQRFEHLDGVFANAGQASFARAAQVSEQDFDALVAVNFKGIFFTVSKALPLLVDGASVVLNGSWLAHRGMGFTSLYAATKAAVVNLARTLAADLADRRIRVNAISPGFIVTEMFEAISNTEEAREGCRKQVVLGRLGQSQDVAGAVAFLLSDQASYITGQEIAVDGGLTTSIPM